MSHAPDRLTLGDLRRFVEESGEGRLQIQGEPPDWQMPLGPAANDSRDVLPGGLFVALPGERTDGHRFVNAALTAGAAAVLLTHLPEDLAPAPAVLWLVPDPLPALQHFAGWWRRQFPDLIVAGITGSVGKTTAKGVLGEALATQMPVLVSPRNFNNEIGLPLTLLSLEGRHRAAVLEMGMYVLGDIAFLGRLARHDIAVVLNVDAVHMSRAGSIENIARAKQEIVDTLSPTGTAVLNADDPRVLAMGAVAPARVLTFGLASTADWQATDVQVLPDGLTLTLVREGTGYALRSPLPGPHHVVALLAAAAALEAGGVPVAQIPEALAAVSNRAARQQFLPGKGDRLLIDDTYNASPLSMVAALDLLAAQQAPRRVAILADMLELGPASEEKHRQVGVHAAVAADLVIAVGPQARSLADAAGRHARWYPDKESLRGQIEMLLAPGDAVLIKGSRGMAMEEVVAWLKAD